MTPVRSRIYNNKALRKKDCSRKPTDQNPCGAGENSVLQYARANTQKDIMSEYVVRSVLDSYMSKRHARQSVPVRMRLYPVGGVAYFLCRKQGCEERHATSSVFAGPSSYLFKVNWFLFQAITKWRIEIRGSRHLSKLARLR